jgi:antitoxin component of MazEF toxin-antitoxin module
MLYSMGGVKQVKFQYKVRSVGGALVVTIPAHILRLVPLKAGDTVVFNTVGKARAIVIEPTKRIWGK